MKKQDQNLGMAQKRIANTKERMDGQTEGQNKGLNDL